MSVSINGTTGLSLGAGSITFPDSTTQSTAASGFGFKNRIINGAMVIDQRNAGASGTAINVYTLDRWGYAASQASKGTWGQNLNSVTLPAGFTKYLGFQSSSAYSVGSGDYFALYHTIEGLNVADFGWGTINAKTVTLSFQVYSSLTGTFGGVLNNNGATRSYPFTYTVSSPNAWTTISVTIPGDTSGTWLTTNGLGIQILFGLGVGSTYSGTASSWASANYVSATGATSVVGTNGATFYITGVQLEKGSTATSFDYRPYGTELALCQRYYIRYGYPTNTPSDGTRFGTAIGSSTTEALGVVPTPVAMRSLPTAGYSSVGVGNSAGVAQLTSLTTGSLFNNSIGVTAGFASGITASSAYQFRHYSATAYMDFSSEL